MGLGTRGDWDAAGVDGNAVLAKARERLAVTEGQTVVMVAVDGKAAGVLGVADPIKDSTAERSSS